MEKAQVLIVEDEGIIALDICSSLKNLGYSVPAIVSTGEEAIKKVEEHNPDLVLIDIVLKGEMDGIEAAEIIRSRFGTTVIFLTAYADRERLKRAKLTTPFGFILKPFEDRDLQVTIEMALYTDKTDAERRQAEERYRVLVETMNDGLVVLDKNMSITYTNNRFCQMLGYSPNELIGRHGTEVLDEDNQRILKEQIGLRKKGIERPYELTFTRKDGHQ